MLFYQLSKYEKKQNDRPLLSDDVKEAPYFSFYIGM